ncbi:TPA_asm: nucleocapsid protein [Pennisetum virus 1]|uniref:Nucleoprotein n=1 Tax=Pennisetum virus 1 TaxID=2977978 RepID=A0A9N7AB08_9RHAB|nr:TPA_asm: nucleocapsid protein [Pennisetum virus 1]
MEAALQEIGTMMGEIEGVEIEVEPPTEEVDLFSALRTLIAEDPDEQPTTEIVTIQGTQRDEEPHFNIGNISTYVDNLDVTKMPLRSLDKFARVRGIKLNTMQTPIPPWVDACLCTYTPIRLEVLSDAQCEPLCEAMFHGLTQEMTEQAAANIMLLAWQLRQFDRTRRVLPETDQCLDNKVPLEISALSTDVLGEGSIVYGGGDTSNMNLYITACAYVAASLLRLFTKTPENYSKAIAEHIPGRFYKFYLKKFPLRDFKPDIKCLEALAMIFNSRTVYKGTLAPFLYCYEDLVESKGMCQMLYEQHLGLTGMHVVNLFQRVAKELHGELDMLCSFMFHVTTEDALVALCDLIADYILRPADSRKRQTWKYARLFGQEHFAVLQTKSCRNLVYSLAYMAKELGISGNQDVMNIVHIKRMGDSARLQPTVWAQRAIKWFQASEQVTRINPFTRL